MSELIRRRSSATQERHVQDCEILSCPACGAKKKVYRVGRKRWKEICEAYGWDPDLRAKEDRPLEFTTGVIPITAYVLDRAKS